MKLREYRNELLKESLRLSNYDKYTFNKKCNNYNKVIDIKDKQNNIYKKWLFFDTYIKESEKL